MRLKVLGPIELSGRHGNRGVRGGKLAQVTGLLALRANQFVSIETIAEELWAGAPPRNEVMTIRTHIYHLRKVLESVQGGPPAQATLLTRPTGYLLSMPAELLDVDVFDLLAEEGRVLLDAGRCYEASDRLRAALGVWRGSALQGVPVGPVLSAHVARLAESHSRVRELRIEADLRAGRHRDMVPELRELVAADPLNEWLQARLMEVLDRSGRRGEALQTFQNAWRHLDEQLGIEPSDDLRQVQRRILAASAGRS
ncbi:AfsR/SARP family transcriptional regulator [Lentzea aerocolonigenes]|uniref:AfsR/SARP family transcriptional regulator n=1 Tax=Lentzea aerocolonigenes TaxID=68170 RepID=UPI0004C3DDE3|nr:AfsR/SARP family transcriptional regulator [Lentzea aerocolonigenes]MCP2248796.1 DNA-binding transcriptional activator of the SARP family [Lentzea aerocolonigenes]